MDTQRERVDGRAVGPVGLVLLLVLALLVGGAISALLWAGEDDASVADDDNCAEYRTVDVAAAPALSGVLMPAMNEIAPDCTMVNLTFRTGAEVALSVASGGLAPDVWIPDARFWMTPTYLGEKTEPGCGRWRAASPAHPSCWSADRPPSGSPTGDRRRCPGWCRCRTRPRPRPGPWRWWPPSRRPPRWGAARRRRGR